MLSIDKRAAFAICSYIQQIACPNVNVTNNIAAGAPYAGFVVKSHDCGAEDT